MDDRRLLRLPTRAGGALLQEVADLSAYTDHPINDMVVGGDGTAYIGSFGFDLHARRRRRSNTVLLMVGRTARTASPPTTWRSPTGW